MIAMTRTRTALGLLGVLTALTAGMASARVHGYALTFAFSVLA